MELAGSRQVVSTRIPVRATMRRTMVARMAMAARPMLVLESGDTGRFRGLKVS